MNMPHPLNILPIIAQAPSQTFTSDGRDGVQAGGGADADLAEQAGDAISQYVHDTLFKPIYDATTEFTNTVLEAISTYWMKLSVAPIFQPPTTNDQGITTPGTYDQLFTNTNQGALVQVSFAILMISLIIAEIRII